MDLVNFDRDTLFTDKGGFNLDAPFPLDPTKRLGDCNDREHRQFLAWFCRSDRVVKDDVPEWPHIRISYSVKRSGKCVVLPIEQLTDEELTGRAELYRRMALGCLEHATELDCYRESRAECKLALSLNGDTILFLGCNRICLRHCTKAQLSLWLAILEYNQELAQAPAYKAAIDLMKQDETYEQFQRRLCQE